MTEAVLVTGITGNVGSIVAKHLKAAKVPVRAGVRNLQKTQSTYGNEYQYAEFDFEKPQTYPQAFQNVNKVFLVRPPAIADPKKITPLVDFARAAGIKQITFLSLMGIERNPLPPHYKIEKYIKASGVPYTFLRPSFFMQNLDTTHLYDIRENNQIFIPAGKAKVSFIDTRDIGEAAAISLSQAGHINKAYTLTGGELLDYYQVAEIFSRVLGRSIEYTSPSPLKFRRVMLERGLEPQFVNVMVVLYLTTRMGMAKKITPDLTRLLGRKAGTVEQYIRDYAHCWNARRELVPSGPNSQ